MIKVFDVVKLKDGRRAIIIEIYKQNVTYRADIETDKGYETNTIWQEDIEMVIN